MKNKCATVICALIYLLIKYRWSVNCTLEYINSKKLDIEITNSILKELRILEQKLAEELVKSGGHLRKDWAIDEYISHYDPYDSDEDKMSNCSR